MNIAWQTFFGTIPLIVVLLGVWFNTSLLLRDILTRLGKLESEIKEMQKEINKLTQRIIALELRAGIIYKD